jgi:hypothetical protein
VCRSFWREYLHLFIFLLGSTTEFVVGFLKSIITAIYWYHTMFLQKSKQTGKTLLNIKILCGTNAIDGGNDAF